MVLRPEEFDYREWTYQCGLCGSSFSDKADRDSHQANCVRPPPTFPKFIYPPGYQTSPKKWIERKGFPFFVVKENIVFVWKINTFVSDCTMSCLVDRLFLLEVLVSFSSLNMVGQTLCLNLNVMGPVCPVNFQRLCRLCLQHFLNGGSQRRHCCTCGFRTRCIKELLDHIARQRLREAGIHCDPCAEARHRQHRIGCVCAVLPMFLNNYWRYVRKESK